MNLGVKKLLHQNQNFCEPPVCGLNCFRCDYTILILSCESNQQFKHTSSLHMRFLADSAMMITDFTLSVGRWCGEREDWPHALYAVVKKMKTLTIILYPWLPQSCLRDCSSSYFTLPLKN